jgi:hypothetical protein
MTTGKKTILVSSAIKEKYFLLNSLIGGESDIFVLRFPPQFMDLTCLFKGEVI